MVFFLKGKFRGLGFEKAKVELTGELSNGDLTTNVAMQHAKDRGMNPRELAAQIVGQLGDIDGVAKIEVAGPGFINFWYDQSHVVSTVSNFAADNVIIPTAEETETIMVEYTQPNPFKPFHIGHLMSNTIGEVLTRMFESVGHQVIRANYQGDVGLHVAKAIWGKRDLGLAGDTALEWGESYVHGSSAYESNNDAKAAIKIINKQVYQNDPAITGDYMLGRQVCLDAFEELYKTLGTKFDHYFFESQTADIGRELVAKGRNQDIFKDSDGAVVFHGEEHGLHTRVFLTSEGLPTYEAKDLGLAVAKADFADFDQSITVTASEQNEYFKVVFTALGLLCPDMAGKYHHVSHGMMQLQSGKMSSRKGNVVTGQSLIQDMVARAQIKIDQSDKQVSHQAAQDIAVAAIKFSILKQSPGKNIVFDEDKSLSFEGDSGPYLQYSAVRISSILEAAGGTDISLGDLQKEGQVIARLLVRYPHIISNAANELSPQVIVHYLLELAQAFNSYYAINRIYNPDDLATSVHRLALVSAVRNVLVHGLNILGIRVPDKM